MLKLASEDAIRVCLVYSSNPTLNEYEMLFPKLEVSPSIITKLWHSASSPNTTEHEI